jgi:hypothetical protein
MAVQELGEKSESKIGLAGASMRRLIDGKGSVRYRRGCRGFGENCFERFSHKYSRDKYLI